MTERIVCWFSCGAASAVATKLAIKAAGNTPLVVCYQDTGSEHPDNVRFLADCEAWFDRPITILKSKDYKDVDDVIERTRWLAGIGGARCTSELKRRVAEEFLHHGHDREVMGYTVEEGPRVERFRQNNPERNLWPILIERGLTKADCIGMIDRAGIEVPAMYKLGFNNNNCIGCVKAANLTYWNMTRKHFPEVFAKRARQERELDAAINKTYVNGVRTRIFLDELDPEAGKGEPEVSIQCGLLCMAEADA